MSIIRCYGLASICIATFLHRSAFPPIHSRIHLPAATPPHSGHARAPSTSPPNHPPIHPRTHPRTHPPTQPPTDPPEDPRNHLPHTRPVESTLELTEIDRALQKGFLHLFYLAQGRYQIPECILGSRRCGVAQGRDQIPACILGSHTCSLVQGRDQTSECILGSHTCVGEPVMDGRLVVYAIKWTFRYKLSDRPLGDAVCLGHNRRNPSKRDDPAGNPARLHTEDVLSPATNQEGGAALWAPLLPIYCAVACQACRSISNLVSQP